MIEYIKGDLLKSDCDVIIHGCNCFCTMGSGIAKSIKDMYPEAYASDCSTIRGDKTKLGTFTYVKIINKIQGKYLYIVNAYTQYIYGRKEGEVYADYDAIRKVMIQINDFFADTHDIQFKIGMPKIGAGLARGDWNIISGIINEVFGSRKVYVYEWDNGEAKKEIDWQKSKDEYTELLKKQYEEKG